MNQTQKSRMFAQIEQHGNQLNAIFNTGIGPVKLCKKLRTLEAQATRLTENECNTGTSHYVELCKILDKVKTILFSGQEGAPTEIYTAVFINGDPRGYALKIKDSVVRNLNLNIYRDMGGYGILAPEFNGTN